MMMSRVTMAKIREKISKTRAQHNVVLVPYFTAKVTLSELRSPSASVMVVKKYTEPMAKIYGKARTGREGFATRVLINAPEFKLSERYRYDNHPAMKVKNPPPKLTTKPHHG